MTHCLVDSGLLYYYMLLKVFFFQSTCKKKFLGTIDYYTNKLMYKMESKSSQGQGARPQLEFKVENQLFKTFDQYITGRQIKELAGIPIETELFLSIAKPYQDELIEDDKIVNIARPEMEYFFVKKKLHFSINGQPFTWYKQHVRGIQLRELGNISPEEDLFLDIKEGWQDDKILDDEVVDLARPGKERFFSRAGTKEFIIIVNLAEKVWKEKTITFEQLIVLAFGAYDNNPNKGYTVTYSRGLDPKPEGTLVKGASVNAKHKMVFDVTATDKS